MGRKYDSWMKTRDSNQTMKGKRQSRNKRKSSSQTNDVDEDPDRTTGGEADKAGGNQHLPVLNGDINNQFQLEGLYSFIDFMQK